MYNLLDEDGVTRFWNKVKSFQSYSTTETVCGDWLGSNLYRKVINCGTGPNATTKSVAHGISNINLITNVSGFGTGTNSAYAGALIYADDTNIYIESDEDITDFTFYVVLEYTKTNVQNE